ncbi:Wzz/FepE/Etk N-terminal domain-containing protein [Rothia nasimurium]|uniref:Wzz/FepE/Etk N-terminal domain-containing protein n=1 Tax=Rothia nasimurium TaxID=85336 RepID=UPI001623D70B|nr:Wzz/FepE/Etk N-terminal domain-containing protein [Rothia nasimurium]
MERQSRVRTNDQQTTPVSLGAAARRVLRHRFVVLTSLIIFAALGAVAGLALPNSYEAKTVINVTQPSSGATGLRASLNTIDMDTEEAIAGSRIVLQSAADELGMDVEDLKDLVDTVGHSNSTILDIIVNSDSPEKSAEIANTVAKAYLKHRSDTIRASREETRKNIDAVSKGMDAVIVDQAILGLEATSTDSGTIISVAQAPTKPSNFTLSQTIFIGAGLGLLLGIFAAYIVDRTSRVLGYPERLSEIAQAPVSIIKSGSEEESIAQLLRRMGVADGELQNTDFDGVTIFSPTPRAAGALTTSLVKGLSDSNFAVTEAPVFNSLANNQVKAHIKQNKPLIVDTPASASVAKVLLSADQSGVLLLPFTPKSTVKSVRRLFSELTPSSSTQVIPVYFDTHTHEK